MFALRLLLAAGSLSTLISGAPVAPSFLSNLVSRVASLSLEDREAASAYTVFGGDGETADGWPSQSQWISSFDTMFTANIPIMKASCTQFGAADNSDDEISDLKSSIQSVGSSSGVDPRFILAIVMQESNGCVRAPTTNYGVVNPGLMQSHDGAGSCASLNPCPASEITQMIEDGTEGTSSGDGLKQILAQTGASDVSQYYKAARMYNSGSIDSSGNLGAGIATHCYASDIANRLIGWATGPSACNAGEIATLTGSDPIPGGGSAASSVAAPAPASSTTPVVVAPSPTTASGGVFAQTGDSTTSTPVSTPVATPVVTPAAGNPNPIVTLPAAATSAAPVTISTVSVVPTAASSVVVPPPVATSAAPSPPASTGTSSSSGGYPAGSACTTEGEWNCITTSSFQQCGSGTWSVVQQLAAGTECTVGQGSSIDISAIVSKRSLGHTHAHMMKHVRHAF